MTYRQAHETRLRIEATAATPSPDLVARADRLYQTALDRWPDHHDCRSEFAQFLLDTGRYAACVDQLAIVLERLDSRELYQRRGAARGPLYPRDLAHLGRRSGRGSGLGQGQRSNGWDV